MVGKFGVVQGEFPNLARIISFGGASEPERCNLWCWAHPELSPSQADPMTSGPAPRGLAEPTPAALCSTASPKNLRSPPPPHLLHQNNLLQVAQAAAEAPLARRISLVETSRPAKRSQSLLQGKGLHLRPLAPPCCPSFHFLPLLLHHHRSPLCPSTAAPSLTLGCRGQLAAPRRSRRFPFCLPRFLGFKLFLPH